MNKKITSRVEPAIKAQFPAVPLDPHTVYILCGPAYCGKSTFTKALSYAMEVSNLSFEVLSSDEIRLDILNKSRLSPITPGLVHKAPLGFTRQAEAMISVSGSAFQILEARLEALMKFPVITEALIVDTTAASESFRNKIRELANKYHYKTCLITFEYNSKTDYFPEGVTAKDREIIENSLSHFKRKVLPTLRAKDYTTRVRIKTKIEIDESDGGAIEDVIDEWLYPNGISPSRAALKDPDNISEIVLRDICSDLHAPMSTPTKYAVIGDSHECTKELKELVDRTLSAHPGVKIVHIGDYLDKGGDTKNMVEYMFTRMEAGDIILPGNHESYVYKRLTGKLEEVNEELEKEYFTSVSTLLSDEGLKAKFFQIYRNSKPIAVLCDFSHEGGIPVYVTHAPCDEKYLGKFDPTSLREQRNYRTKDRTKPFHEELSWLYDQADFNGPLHIFGHVSHKGGKYLNYKNKVFLDTGAVYGGELTAVVVQAGKIIDRLSVVCEKRSDKPISDNLAIRKLSEKPFNIEDFDLSSHDIRLMNHVMKNDISYISGTMAPAPSLGGDLESLEAGLNHFAKSGITEVVLQPKFMGSRGQLYLKRGSPESTRFTSRAGWTVRKIEGLDDAGFEAFKLKQYEQYSRLLGDLDEVILDGEILPWAALGMDLILNSFAKYRNSVEAELLLLQSSLGRPELEEFAGKLSLGEKLANLEKFDNQLEIFGKLGDPSYAPFDILWSKKDIHQEIIKDNQIVYETLALYSENPLRCLKLDLNDPESMAKAKNYMDTLVKVSNMEGIVIKPAIKSVCNGITPYIKVRNPEYLRLVYGFDYTSEDTYRQLCSTKNIRGKVKLSVQEHTLANTLLATRDKPETQEDFKQSLIVQMIGSMKREKELDPRL